MFIIHHISQRDCFTLAGLFAVASEERGQLVWTVPAWVEALINNSEGI